MAKLGFLGLGLMGYPMARNLLKAGHDVALWSNNGSKAQQLVEEKLENAGKGTACSSPKQVAEASDCIFYCVGDSDMSRQVALGDGGLIEGAKSGSVVADCSTIAPDTSVEIGKAFATKGVQFLDAPCTGSTPGAEGGTLTFMIGGDEAVFNRVKAWFDPMGKLFYYCGGPGMGLNAKLTQNLVLANIMEAFNEGIVLSTKAGIKPELMLEVLANSAAKSGLIAFKAPFILDRNFKTNFSTKWMHKDIGMALDSGKRLGVPLPVTSLTHQLFQATMSKGYADDDFCSTIKVLEDMAGIVVKKS